jgi:hypothetical protein
MLTTVEGRHLDGRRQGYTAPHRRRAVSRSTCPAVYRPAHVHEDAAVEKVAATGSSAGNISLALPFGDHAGDYDMFSVTEVNTLFDRPLFGRLSSRRKVRSAADLSRASRSATTTS